MGTLGGLRFRPSTEGREDAPSCDGAPPLATHLCGAVGANAPSPLGAHEQHANTRQFQTLKTKELEVWVGGCKNLDSSDTKRKVL